MNTINPDTATLDECRDWLASLTHTHYPQFNSWVPKSEKSPTINPNFQGFKQHPIAPTLDEAARLPSPWKLVTLTRTTERISAHAISIPGFGVSSAEASDRMLCEFRLRVACEIQDALQRERTSRTG